MTAEPADLAPAPASSATADAADQQPEAVVEAEVLIRNLCVLPPRQKRNGPNPRVDLDALGAIPLPVLRPEEPVQSIRTALGELKDYAHITKYRLVVEDRPDGIDAALSARRNGTAVNGSGAASSAAGNDSGRTGSPTNENGTNAGAAGSTSPKKNKKKKKKGGGGGSATGNGYGGSRGSSPFTKSVAPNDVVSPHTGPNAVVSIPATVRSLEADPSAYTPFVGSVFTDFNSNKDGLSIEEVVLDDFADLSPYLAHAGLDSGNAALRMVLERYDAASVRDHVARLRLLFDGLVPNVTTLVEGEDAEGGEEVKSGDPLDVQEGQEKKAVNADVEANGVEKGDEKAKEEEAKKNSEKERVALLSKLPSFPLETTVTIDGSNLEDYFYLACGEEDDLDVIRGRERKPSVAKANAARSASSGNEEKASDEVAAAEAEAKRNASSQMVEVEARCRIPCKIKFGGFHPPPPHRRVHGELAYLEVTLPGSSKDVVHITAVPSGFYVNKTSIAPEGYGSPYVFDPRPADNSCYSHELLDCLLLYSKTLRSAWADALEASKARAALTIEMSANESPLHTLYRVATRSDLGTKQTANCLQHIDNLLLEPSWLVPKGESNSMTSIVGGDGRHEYNQARSDEELASTFGLDLRVAAPRDWNEELQSARELPRGTIQERLDRAKMVHKVLMEFGDASLVGVKAIVDGLILPMNPNEPARSHVFLHNNIFFSRAVDAGVDTFKVTQGDKAAKKAASRDANCIGLLHKFDFDGLHNLATVLVDYLGTRFVCQSIVPGILQGEKTHSLLYGAVEATQPLSCDAEMHALLEDKLGEAFMIATRPVPTFPLSDERLAHIKELREASLDTLGGVSLEGVYKNDSESVANKPLTVVCGPIEAKGIRGSDQRNYLLDLSRLTPRDANWVPESEGGTGRWEAIRGANTEKVSAKATKYVPESLSDDENAMALLRSELVTLLTHKEMAKHLAAKKTPNASESTEKKDEDSPPVASNGVEQKNEDEKGESTRENVKNTSDDAEQESKSKMRDPEDEEKLLSLRLNPNVFLPNIKSLEDIDEEAYQQIKKDEERVREAAAYLWDDVLPAITLDIKENSSQMLPSDGKTLTDLLHQRGINCRYLGRLATLAIEAEAKDRKAEADFASGEIKSIPRRTMPLCWLELLECEMVTRAAKHVVDSYLAEHGNATAAAPAQTVACILSALISAGEESAGDTELRLTMNGGAADENNAEGAPCAGGFLGPMFTRSRAEIWEDIEREIGRRFRYVLTLYNNPQSNTTKGKRKSEKKSRAFYAPLLRRLCQRIGVRLIAKKYNLGAKCVCTGNNSYPIAMGDIAAIVPLVKYAAAATGEEGFHPASFDYNSGPSSLHILLPDAKNALDAARAAWTQKALPQALELFSEASALYQRVVDTPLHSTVAKCIDMTAAILFHAGEVDGAAANAARSLAIAIQLHGFDSSEALNAHNTLSHILLGSNNADAAGSGIKHLRASIYLTELMAGPHNVDLVTLYHKLGTMYHEVGSPINALRFYQEAASRENGDRLVSAMVAKGTAIALANLGQFKSAVDSERRAYNIYRSTLGEGHVLAKNSEKTLAQLTKIAVEHGTRAAKAEQQQKEELAANEQKQKEELAANAAASAIVADEDAAAAKTFKKKKKKKKGKKA